MPISHGQEARLPRTPQLPCRAQGANEENSTSAREQSPPVTQFCPSVWLACKHTTESRAAPQVFAEERAGAGQQRGAGLATKLMKCPVWGQTHPSVEVPGESKTEEPVKGQPLQEVTLSLGWSIALLSKLSFIPESCRTKENIQAVPSTCFQRREKKSLQVTEGGTDEHNRAVEPAGRMPEVETQKPPAGWAPAGRQRNEATRGPP